MPARIVVVLAEGFEEIEAVTPIDVLRRAELEVTTLGVGQKTVTGSHGIPYVCDALLSDLSSTPDCVVLPGGLPGADNLGQSDAVRELVLKVQSNGGLCAAICAAPALAFARFGLLDGKTATCYPTFEKHFPESTTHSEDRVVVDGRLVTSRGPGTALEFALQLVAMLKDQGTADQLRGQMLVA